MKQNHTLIPKGVYREEPPVPSGKTGAAYMPSVAMSAPLRKRAKAVLDAPETENRLTLILGILTVIGLGFASPMILDCLLVVSEVLSLLSETGEVLWPAILCIALNVAVALLFTLPLMTALFRMAVLMTEAHRKSESGGPVGRVGLSEIFYPFTSWSAYARTQLVAWGWLVGILCLPGLPVAVIALAAWWIPAVSQGLSGGVAFLLWIANVLAAVGLPIFFAALLCRRAGWGYLLFLHPEIPAKELKPYFKARRRSVGLPLWLAAGNVGWSLLSLVAVCVPFMIHTIPLMLLTSASYGRYLDESAEETKAEISPETTYGKDESASLSLESDPT